jgi:two-component system, LytTR family, response regulator
MGKTDGGGMAQARGAVWALGGLTILYVVVFLLTGGTVFDSARAALCNAIPAVGFGWLVAARIAPSLWPIGSAAKIFGIAATLIGFALISYIATLVLLALSGGASTETGLLIRYFTGPAFVWQSFQGLAYGLIALLTGWLGLAAQASGPAETAAGGRPLGRLLIRTDVGIVPIDGDDVVRISGADDYCELVLPHGRHLARMTLGECEGLLADQPLVRLHRSHIISLRHLISAEPAGDGRLQVTLSNGDQVISSRAGARALREQSG